MNWGMVAAVIAGLGLLGAYMTWFVKTVIREQNDELLKRINGTYVRSAGSDLTGAEIGRRLHVVEEKECYLCEKSKGFLPPSARQT